MSYLKAFFALLKGFQLCFRVPEIRRLAMRPWLAGALIYPLACAGAYYAHDPILNWLVNEPSGFWGHVVYYLVRVIVPIVLLIGTMISSIALVMLVTAVFQADIALRVLEHVGVQVPEEEAGLSGVVKEAGRALRVETAKLMWLLPLMILSLVLGLIPFLTPFALAMAAWLLGYEFFDVVLDIYRTKAGTRLKFSLKNGLLVISYGLGLTVLWAVPFCGLLLPPVAVAGAAWLLAESGRLEQFAALGPKS